MRKIVAGLAGGLLIVSAAVGCSTERRTVRRETETVVPQTPPRVIEEHTTIQRAPAMPEDEERTIIHKRQHTETIETED
jgi:hypothetical protein